MVASSAHCASLLCHSLPRCQLLVGVHLLTHRSGSEYVYLSVWEQYVLFARLLSYFGVTQSGQAGGNLRTGAVFLVAVFMGVCICVNTCARVGIICFLKGFKGQPEACHFYRGLILHSPPLFISFFLPVFPPQPSIFIYLFSDS